MKIPVQFVLTEEEKSELLRADYGTENKNSDRTIGRYVCLVCEEGILITRGRESFIEQRLKDTVVKRLQENKRLSFKTRRALASNYTHYLIKYEIWKIMYKRLRDQQNMV